jgi:hypothetical protein
MSAPRPRYRRYRRKATGRLPAAGIGSPWELEHNAFTIEGQIEGLNRFMGAMAHARGWRRTAARIMGWVLLLSIFLPAVRACLSQP